MSKSGLFMKNRIKINRQELSVKLIEKLTYAREKEHNNKNEKKQRGQLLKKGRSQSRVSYAAQKSILPVRSTSVHAMSKYATSVPSAGPRVKSVTNYREGSLSGDVPSLALLRQFLKIQGRVVRAFWKTLMLKCPAKHSQSAISWKLSFQLETSNRRHLPRVTKNFAISHPW